MNQQILKTEKKAVEKVLKKRKGVVVSDKMDKTIVVSVTTVKTHPKYQKKFKVTRRYKVHDEKNEYKIGDQVFFVECRPFSREKKWRVLSLVEKL